MISFRSFFRSTAGNYTIMFLKMAAGILMIPVCLQLYGQELFGIYLLSFGLSTTLAFLDFGANKTLFRYTAEFRANKDIEKFKLVSSSTYSINVIASILIAIVILVIGFLSIYIFNIPAQYKHDTMLLFVLSAVNGGITLLGYFPSGILTGLGLFEKRNKWQVIPPILNLLFIYLMYETGSISIAGFAVASAGLTLLSAVIDYILIKHNEIFRHLSFKIRITKGMFRNEHMNYTAGIFALSVIGFLGIQADRLIIASISTISAVTTYTIITRPYFLLKGLFANGYTVLLPSLIKENTNQNVTGVHQMITKVTRASLIILFSISLFIALFFEEGLHLWLNTAEYDQYAIWGIIALLNICIPAFYGLLSRLMQLSEHIFFILRTNIWLIAINFLVSIVMTRMIGFQGVILGTTVQMILEFIFILRWGARRIKYNPAAIFTSGLIGSLLFLVLLSFAVKYMIDVYTPGIIIPAVLLTMIIYALVIILFLRKDKTMTAFKPV